MPLMRGQPWKVTSDFLCEGLTFSGLPCGALSRKVCSGQQRSLDMHLNEWLSSSSARFQVVIAWFSMHDSIDERRAFHELVPNIEREWSVMARMATTHDIVNADLDRQLARSRAQRN
jgi:hypothetical protein